MAFKGGNDRAPILYLGPRRVLAVRVGVRTEHRRWIRASYGLRRIVPSKPNTAQNDTAPGTERFFDFSTFLI